MHAQQQSSPLSDPRGYVTRTYPVILDRWQSLNDLARCAARSLYAEMSPGDMFRIVHRQFYRELPSPYESGSRRAFDRLIEVGLVYVVMSSKGRRGETIYRLADATEVYLSRGLRSHADEPQQMLPFAVETAEEQDLGGGIIRLFDPNQCAKSGALDCATSGAAPNLAQQECAKSGALTQQDGTAGMEKSGRLQHGTQRRIEQPQSVASGGVAAMEATTWDRESDQLAVPSQRRSDGFGTRDASRAHTVWTPIQEQETLTPNQYSNPNPNPNHFEPPTNSERALAGRTEFDESEAFDPDAEEFIDALIANSRDIHRELADSTSRKIRKAVRSAEAKVGITSRDRERFMHSWVADEWGFHVADGAIDVEEVELIVRHVKMLADRDAFKASPGAFVVSRLKNLARRAGVELRKSSHARRPK